MKLERQIKKWTIGLTMVIMMFILAAGAVKVEAKSRTKTQPILNHAQVIAYPAMKTTVLKVKNLKEGQSVKWSSSKPGVASVAEDGTVNFLKKGNTIITAKVGKKNYNVLCPSVVKRHIKRWHRHRNIIKQGI